jgi:hypothetical protein
MPASAPLVPVRLAPRGLKPNSGPLEIFAALLSRKFRFAPHSLLGEIACGLSPGCSTSVARAILNAIWLEVQQDSGRGWADHAVLPRRGDPAGRDRHQRLPAGVLSYDPVASWATLARLCCGSWQVDIVVTGTDRRERPAQTKSPYFRPKSLSEKYWQPLSLSHRTASRIVGRAHSSISGVMSVTWKPPPQIHEIEALIPLA